MYFRRRHNNLTDKWGLERLVGRYLQFRKMLPPPKKRHLPSQGPPPPPSGLSLGGGGGGAMMARLLVLASGNITALTQLLHTHAHQVNLDKNTAVCSKPFHRLINIYRQ